MPRQYRHIIILIFLIQSICGQTKTTFDYLKKSDSVMTVLFGNDNWKKYYSGQRSWMTFESAEGSKIEIRNDTLEDVASNETVVPYEFIMPNDLNLNANCSSLSLRIYLRFDSFMGLTNPEELTKIPEFIKSTDKYIILHPKQIKEFAEQYNFEKGIDKWHYCLSYSDTLKIMIWIVKSKIKDETAKEQELGKCIDLNAFNGKLIRRYDITTQNLSERPEKYRVK